MKRAYILPAVFAGLIATSFLFKTLRADEVEGKPRLDRDLLEIPVVLSGDAQYRMQLQRDYASTRRRTRVSNAESTEFRVVEATKITGASSGTPAVLKHGVLRIPVIHWGELDYRMELRAVDSTAKAYTLVSATPLNAPQKDYAVLPDGRGGYNFEPVYVDEATGFDKARSLAAFKETLYPYLRNNVCSGCHNSRNLRGAGAQAPMHTDWDPNVAHEYALTRVNFADPNNSKLVVRMRLDRHNCPNNDCAAAGEKMLEAINAWKSRIADMLPATPRSVAADVKIAEADVVQWIAEDRARLANADRDFIIYTSLHELHNEGLTADELNIVRTGLSKALNSVARWAPKVVNPTDVNGKGLLYKFDIRDYWGWNKGVTRLLFGGSDDDLAFGRNKRDYRGTLVDASVQRERYNYSANVTRDPEFSKVIWERILHGNVEGAVTTGTIPAYINGFRGKRSRNAAGEYIAPADFEWVEASQLIYTLTRPDVYNAIMMLPWSTDQLEDELGVDKRQRMDSYDYFVTFDSIAVDSRLLWRANTSYGGSYWKSWDVFSGQLAGGDRNIFDVYKEGGNDIRFPWWANPVPVFVDPNVNRPDTRTWSFVASLAQPFGTPPPGCDAQPNFSGISGFYNCRHFTGTGGGQQSASEIIWNLPNGLQGYMLSGAFNQRRVDAFVNIVRDPRLIPNAADNIATQTGFAFGKKTGGIGGFNDPRLNVGSSCIGCHIDGMNRVNNNLRDWIDEASPELPKGPYGVDPWVNNADTVKRVRELYPPSSIIRSYIEQGRQTFLEPLAEIKHNMILGPDKNVYVEPVIWTVEYVQRRKYRYPQTTSN
jgi:hypothetical protein